MAEKVEIVELPTSPPPRSQSEADFPLSSSSSPTGVVTSPPVIEGIVELPGESSILVEPGSGSDGGASGKFVESGTVAKVKESSLHQLLLERQKALLGSLAQQTATNQSQLTTASSSSTTTTTTRKVIRSISSSSTSTTQFQQQLEQTRQQEQQVSTSASCSSLLPGGGGNGSKKAVTFFGEQHHHQQQQHLQTFSSAQRSLASMSSPCISSIMADVTEEEEGGTEESCVMDGREGKVSGEQKQGSGGGVNTSLRVVDEDEAQKRMRIMADNLSLLSTSVASVAHHESIKEAMKASASTSSTLQTAEGANVATSSASVFAAAHQRRRLMNVSRTQKQHQSMIVLSRTSKQSCRSHKFFRLITTFFHTIYLIMHIRDFM